MSAAVGPPEARRVGEGPDGVTRYHGKYPAIVVDNEPDGDEVHRGELLVAVPAILEDAPSEAARDAGELGIETSANASRQPIRVLAKPCFAPGAFFLPEPGHAVWVEFAAGDVNEPIWSGVWLPKGGTPAASDDTTPTAAQRIIRTTSGHVVEFDDRDGQERIVVRGHSGSTVVLDGEGVRVDTEGAVEVRAATVVVECDRLTVRGELRVTNGTASTTIAGNQIRGA